MSFFKKSPKILFLLIGISLLSACATSQKKEPASKPLAYVIQNDEVENVPFAPVFIIENPEEEHNLIGTPSARLNKNDQIQVFVNPEMANIYQDSRTFMTAKGDYTNIIYRIHFEEVPLKLSPYSIGEGKNVGAILIETLNQDGNPVLYTTVHTCGCYLAFVPTSYMPKDAFPKRWNKKRQRVQTKTLPGMLDMKNASPETTRVMFLIESGSHRIKNVWLENPEASNKYQIEKVETQPLDSLDYLSLGNGETTSFFEGVGSEKGYVKNNQKIWERLFMSWWTFDPRIGEDKKLGTSKEDGPVFYTSLKPWNKEKSDMRDFASFLQFWGWNL